VPVGQEKLGATSGLVRSVATGAQVPRTHASPAAQSMQLLDVTGQSVGQVAVDSSPSHAPLPQQPGDGAHPHSPASHVEEAQALQGGQSGGAQHAPQSPQQMDATSLGPQQPSPHATPQSPGQPQVVSPAAHSPSPQPPEHGAQEPPQSVPCSSQSAVPFAQ
jgi:hypothetical protein